MSFFPWGIYIMVFTVEAVLFADNLSKGQKSRFIRDRQLECLGPSPLYL